MRIEARRHRAVDRYQIVVLAQAMYLVGWLVGRSQAHLSLSVGLTAIGLGTVILLVLARLLRRR